MKKAIYLLFMFLSAGMAVLAQAPQQFNYQGVARGLSGSPMSSQLIGLRITVHDGSPTGTAVYQETQSVTTNAFGLYTLAVGGGSVVSGTFNTIAWGAGGKYMQVEIDPAGGTAYVPAGTNQLLSVPYSVYANTASYADTLNGTVNMGGDVAGTNAAASVVKIQGNGVSTAAPTAGQVLEWNTGTSTWTPTNLPAASAGTVASVTAGTGLSGGVITTSGTISMPAVGTAGTYGDATHYAAVTTDAEGRVSGVATYAVAPAVTSVTAGAGLSGGIITGTGTISMPAVGAAGTYGSATEVPVFTTDAEGRVTSVTNTIIPAGGTVSGVTAGTGLTGGTITTSGTIGMPAVGAAGTYGDASHFAAVTTDAEGRVSSVATYAIAAGGVTSVTAGTGLTGGTITGTGTIGLSAVGTAGTYGSGTTVPVFTTDAEGRVMSVVNTPIASTGGTVTSVTAGTGLLGGVITGVGSVSMPTVGTAGTYGSSTQIPVITTDAEGRVTGVTNTTIASGGSLTSITAGTGLTGGTITTSGTINLSNVGSAGTYGSSSQIPVITTDAQGRVTSVSNTAIAAGSVTSVTAGSGLTGGTITGSGTINMPNVGTAATYGDATHHTGVTTDAQGRVTAVTTYPDATGTVTSVAAGTGLTGGTITGAGTINLANVGTAGSYGDATHFTGVTTDAQGRVTSVTTYPGASGTVTSVTAGAGLTGGTITSAGTVAMATVGTAGTYGSATQVPAITTDAYGRVTGVTNTTITVPTVSGTVSYFPKFTGVNSIGNSQLRDWGPTIGISGGYSCTVGGTYGNNLCFGESSQATGGDAVSLGWYNFATGFCATALGTGSTASGIYSTALGTQMSTNGHDGAFMIGDDNGGSVYTYATTDNQFTARFANGYMLYTNIGATIGVKLNASATSWSVISDRKRKENFEMVNGEDFLKRISRFELSSWNYKGTDPKFNRHYGPMAQDFFAAFGKDGYGISGDDTTICQGDMEGVSFIAIQALEKRTEKLQAENDQLKAQLAALQAKTNVQADDLNARMASMEAMLSKQQANGKVVKE